MASFQPFFLWILALYVAVRTFPNTSRPRLADARGQSGQVYRPRLRIEFLVTFDCQPRQTYSRTLADRQPTNLLDRGRGLGTVRKSAGKRRTNAILQPLKTRFSIRQDTGNISHSPCQSCQAVVITPALPGRLLNTETRSTQESSQLS
ncbi:hypothetical protein Bbelb_338500 [Branchiostoma belcheri]|nr:hypothetical protein Bbelb_338500 [Branchiostoma belcheri]